MNEYHAINEYTGVVSGETSFIPLGIYPVFCISISIILSTI